MKPSCASGNAPTMLVVVIHGRKALATWWNSNRTRTDAARCSVHEAGLARHSFDAAEPCRAQSALGTAEARPARGLANLTCPSRSPPCPRSTSENRSRRAIGGAAVRSDCSGTPRGGALVPTNKKRAHQSFDTHIYIDPRRAVAVTRWDTALWQCARRSVMILPWCDFRPSDFFCCWETRLGGATWRRSRFASWLFDRRFWRGSCAHGEIAGRVVVALYALFLPQPADSRLVRNVWQTSGRFNRYIAAYLIVSGTSFFVIYARMALQGTPSSAAVIFYTFQVPAFRYEETFSIKLNTPSDTGAGRTPNTTAGPALI